MPIRSDLVNIFLFEDINSKSEICFGTSNKKSPFTSNSSSESVLGVVNLLINKPRTVIIKIAIKSKFLFIDFI
ncbi:MAG: camk family protein kinase [SAR86 cluster bacterium SAR86B]|uniref:Camk family protein kinase n=1 Tax=SAR86 cluster bacterium SAR86B TaxID=1123867 RepID=J5KJ76_9GAMM|nr:MAG: camk family protein kinase [SAR86 cluster bacterium SAR86B]